MRRRNFLGWTGRIAGAVFGWLAFGGIGFRHQHANASPAPADSPAPSGEDPGFFTPEEAVTIGALLERLIPYDIPPGAPGARETRVLTYLDRQLREPRYERYQELIRIGLATLDRLAGCEDKLRFHRLTPERQDRLLGQLQQGKIREGRFHSGRFFRVVHTLALEGHWGDPKYGGNHDKLAWRWVEIDPGCESGIYSCR